LFVQKELQMTNRLSDIVKTNPRFYRSINISQDLEDVDILKSFICPTSFRLALSSIADNVGATKQSAFTWVGPYGAGKSSLALLLSSLLSPKKDLRDLANGVIGTDTAKNFNGKIKTKNGWAIMPIVGDVQDVQTLIAKNIEKHTGKKSNDILAELKSIADKNDGLLLIIDEMGKCLEAAAKGTGEIYFFQQLAEFASRSNGKIILIGILHQAFAEYSKTLPHTMRDEWTKIEGRFANTPINTAGEEQIELISRAITLDKADQKAIEKAILPVAKQTVETIKRNRPVTSDRHLVESLRHCWPINPVVVCLLSQISRKKFGQNQRSIFSFLASGEPRAFRDFVENSTDDAMYMPTDLFEYIKFNLESAIMASTESKIWHIAIDAVQRIQAKGLSEEHLDVLKTIALVDLFNGSSGLVADEGLLEKIYPLYDVSKIIEDLSKHSVILFKKHKNAYSVFEGSDFDIEANLREAYSNVVGLELSKLEEIANFKPVIAKRYYHEYGSMHWFDVLLTEVPNYKKFLQDTRATSGAVGFFSVLLPSSPEEEKQVAKIVKEAHDFGFPVIMTAAHNVRLINEYLRELLALEWIQRSDLPGFVGDSIAQSIVEDRRRIIIELLEVQLGEILSESKWYRGGELLGAISNDKLSALASEICKEQYPSAPKIKSELVNRTKPSGSANSALNALLKDMITNRGDDRLGIEGFCPEAGLFKILLQETGLYQAQGKIESTYVEPTRSSQLHALWKATDKFFGKKHIVEAAEIFDLWSAKPFGVKAGLHNFFLLAYVLTRENEVAVYRDGIYAPNITDTFVDYLISKPKSISLKLVKSDDISVQIMASVIKALNEVSPKVKLSDNATPLAVAQKLVSVVLELKPWVLKTKTLENQTIKLREIVKSANDPNKLLFEDLPKLYKTNNFYEKLKADLSQLIDVYPAMIQSVGILMTTELDILLPTPVHIERLRKRAKNIKGVSGNFKLDAFAARISTFESTIADIEGIIGLANNKPLTEWIDLDIETAKKELMYLCNEFKKAELYSKVKDRPATRQAIAFIAGIGGNAEVVSEEFNLLTDKAKDVQELKRQLEELLSGQKDNALVLTALSEISIERIKKGRK
jgi:energy-coupling factor transporter ATP-binding protein EcfA2